MPPETLADLLTSLQQGCPGPVLGLSCGAQHTLTVLSKLFLAVGGLAAVSVPFVLYRIQRRQAMARATIELGKSIWVDTQLLQKMEKIHRYRRYEDGLSTHTPYNGDEDGLRWDDVIVLNFF